MTHRFGREDTSAVLVTKQYCYVVLFRTTQSGICDTLLGTILAHSGNVSRSKYHVPNVYNHNIKTPTLTMFITSPVFAWKQKKMAFYFNLYLLDRRIIDPMSLKEGNRS